LTASSRTSLIEPSASKRTSFLTFVSWVIGTLLVGVSGNPLERFWVLGVPGVLLGGKGLLGLKLDSPRGQSFEP
jgi:hypothetical protein